MMELEDKMKTELENANWIIEGIRESLETIREAQEAQFCRKEAVFDTSEWDTVAEEEESWE